MSDGYPIHDYHPVGGVVSSMRVMFVLKFLMKFKTTNMNIYVLMFKI